MKPVKLGTKSMGEHPQDQQLANEYSRRLLFLIITLTGLLLATLLIDSSVIRTCISYQEALRPFAIWVTLAGGWGMVVASTSLVIFAFWDKSKEERNSKGIELLCAVIGAIFVSQVVHLLWKRPRPFFQLGLDPLFYQKADFSFPSDHVTFGTAIAVSLISNRLPFGWIACIFAIIAGAARTAALVHWPSDIMGGALIGTLAALTSQRINKVIKQRRGFAGWRTFFEKEDNMKWLIAWFRYFAILYAGSEIAAYLKLVTVDDNINVAKVSKSPFLNVWACTILAAMIATSFAFTWITNHIIFNSTKRELQIASRFPLEQYLWVAIVGDLVLYSMFYMFSQHVESHIFIFFLIPIAATSLLSSFSAVLKGLALAVIFLAMSIGITSHLFSPDDSKQWLILFLFGPRALAALMVAIPLAFIVHIRARYESLVENVPLMIIRKNLNGVITYAGREFCILNNKDKEYLEGKTDFDLYDRQRALAYRADDEKAIKSLDRIPINEKHTALTDVTIDVTGFKKAVRDKSGSVIEVQIVFLDVTKERQQAEQLEIQTSRLKEQAAELKTAAYLMDVLMNNLPDSIYFKDRKSKFRRISKHLADQFRVLPEKAIDKDDFDFFDPVHANEAMCLEQKIIETGEPRVGFFEKEIYKDGRINYVISTKMPLRESLDSEITGTFGVSYDMRDTWQWQAHPGAIVERAGEMIYVRRPDGKFVHMNPNGCELLGYSEQEMTKFAILDIFHPDDLTRAKAMLADGTLNQGSTLRRWKVRTKQGEDLIVEFTTADIQDTDGSPLIVGFGRNVTETQKRESDLQWRSDVWRTSAGIVAHRFGNILPTAQDLLFRLKNMSLRSEEKDHAEKAFYMVDLALDVANNFIKLRLNQKVEMKLVTIDELCAVLKRHFLIMCPWANVSIVGTGKSVIATNLVELKSMFDALYNNSIKFQSDKSLCVKIDIDVTGDGLAACARLTYQDNGIGVGPEYKERIFEPFFTRGKKGTGLGLTDVKEIVNRHRGTIGEVGSKEEGLGGAYFVIQIPLHSK